MTVFTISGEKRKEEERSSVETFSVIMKPEAFGVGLMDKEERHVELCKIEKKGFAGKGEVFLCIISYIF